MFAFIARANDDLHAFSLLAMVVCLFETGLPAYRGRAVRVLRRASLCRRVARGDRGMAIRVADAMRRGALCPGSMDFLRTDWFELAPLTVEQVRARFGVRGTSPPRRWPSGSVGTVGAWAGSARSSCAVGSELAERVGRPYDSFGATV